MPYATSNPIKRGKSYVEKNIGIEIVKPIIYLGKAYTISGASWIDESGRIASAETQKRIQAGIMHAYRKRHPEDDSSYLKFRFIQSFAGKEYPESEESKHVKELRAEYEENEKRANRIPVRINSIGNTHADGSRAIKDYSETVPVFYGVHNKGFTDFEQELFFEGYGSRE